MPAHSFDDASASFGDGKPFKVFHCKAHHGKTLDAQVNVSNQYVNIPSHHVWTFTIPAAFTYPAGIGCLYDDDPDYHYEREAMR